MSKRGKNLPCNEILRTKSGNVLYIGSGAIACNYNLTPSEVKTEDQEWIYEVCGDDFSLKKMKINFVVTLLDLEGNPSDMGGDYEKNGIEQLWIKIMDDDVNDDILQHIPRCMKFIDESLEKGNVLVHCGQGKSRSGSIVVSYVMHRLGLSLEDSLKYCKERRPLIEPNRGFMKQLKEFEKTLDKEEEEDEGEVKV